MSDRIARLKSALAASPADRDLALTSFLGAIGAGQASLLERQQVAAVLADAGIRSHGKIADVSAFIRDASSPIERISYSPHVASVACVAPTPAPRQPSPAAQAGLTAYRAKLDAHLAAVNVARSRAGKPLLTEADVSDSIKQSFMSESVDQAFPDAQLAGVDKDAVAATKAFMAAKREVGVQVTSKPTIGGSGARSTAAPAEVDQSAVAAAKSFRAARYGTA